MKTIALVMLATISSTVYAECFEVKNIAGATMINADHYQIAKDGFGDRAMRITISETSASVSDSDLTCSPLRPYIALCYSDPEFSEWTLETYSIDLAASRLIITTARTGFTAPFAEFNGGKVMIGDIVGSCDEG